MLPLISFETGRRSQTQSSVRPFLGRDSKWKSGSIELGTTRREAKRRGENSKELVPALLRSASGELLPLDKDLSWMSATRKLSRSGVRGHFSTILQPITRLLGRQAFHPKENSWQGSNSLFKLSELQTLTTSRAQVCAQHTDVADCTRLSESTP